MRLLSARLRACSTCSAIFLAQAAAQQFSQAVGVIPGPNRWSEGVTAVDVDLDGDLDLLYANGDGFASAGTPRQNTLVINKLIEQGPGVFVDESVLRLGVQASNAKLAIAGDVNSDGWPDLLYVNAFNTGTPLLYINRGAAQPGFFDMESAARGLTEVLSSAGAQFGDVDDDGDLDIVISDAGQSFLGGAGAAPKLYLNDGAGFFTDASAQLGAPAKVAQMDASFFDFDGDWDLDVMIVNRASNAGGNHYLLLNDGTGQFVDRSSLLPNTSTFVYEAEAADFDGDLDRDIFFLSLSSQRDGTVRNDLVETGALGFAVSSIESGSIDDNEIALFDYDVDGDLDVLVGSLGSTERVYRNDGALNFALAPNVVQAVADSTLDLAVADLDNDGDYDIVTAQGESGNFTNRLYWNNGPADTRAPEFLAVQAPTQAPSWPVTLRGRILDQVLDDGESWVTVSALVTRVEPTVVEVLSTPGGFVPAAVTVTPGTRVRVVDAGGGQVTLTATDPIEWSLDVPPGGADERVFVAPVTHVASAFPSFQSLQIDVVGTAQEVPAMHYGDALFRALIPALPPGPTATFAWVLRAEDWVGNVGWSTSGEIRDPDAPGMSFCEPVLNSTGAQARIVARGSDELAAQSIALEAWALPQSSFGFFLASRTQDALPVSQGIFCLGSPFGRFSNFVQNSGASGAVSLPMPFGSLPPAVSFSVGDTWNFTYWFRDANPAIGANFTDGVELTWR